MRHLLSLSLAFVLSCSNEQGAYKGKAGQARQETQPQSAKDAKAEVEPKEEEAFDNPEKPQAKPAESEAKVPAAPPSSGGKGGPAGLVEVPFTDSRGLASSYKVNAPADVGGKVYGLHIHLHGDGGGGYVDFPNKELRYDLIGVTVKAPNTNLQWGRAQGRPHAFYLNDLIQNELLKKYNVDLKRIFFSTVSGGSYFFTGNFVPEFGQLYKSAAFIMCGGEAPRVAFADPQVLSAFRLHWEVTVGERADITSSVQASVAAYKTASTSAGISGADQAKQQTLTVEGAGGHCVFDGLTYTSGIQQMIDTKFKNVLP